MTSSTARAVSSSVHFTGKKESPSSNLPASIIPGAIQDPRGGYTVGDALLSDLSSVVPLVRPDQTIENRIAVNGIDTEFVEDSDTVGLRCRLNQAGGHEREERFSIDDVETQPCVHAADRVHEKPGPAGV